MHSVTVVVKYTLFNKSIKIRLKSITRIYVHQVIGFKIHIGKGILIHMLAYHCLLHLNVEKSCGVPLHSKETS